MSHPIPVSHFVQERYAFEDVGKGRDHMAWEGQIVELISGLHTRNWVLEEKFWGPSLLVHASVNSQIPDAGDHLGLVNEAINYALGVYSGAENVETRRERLESISKAFEDFDLLDKVIEQPQDDRVAEATDPGLSKQTARRLIRDTRGEILFVPLTPHGLVAGIQTALYHEQVRAAANVHDSIIFPVRFEPESGDTHPHVRGDELRYMQSLAEERMMVVTVESAQRGELSTALEYFRSYVGGLGVIGAATQVQTPQ